LESLLRLLPWWLLLLLVGLLAWHASRSLTRALVLSALLALIGMIIKNAVILVGQIESERAAGKDARQAVTDAACARFTPIMLTALSTVLGMIPIAPTVFWGPMAFAIMGGLMVATLLTLVFLPALYLATVGRERRFQG
ncbi:MAG: efflux RND transporter permease subunit, partial [Starkeya sp.]|nr:efflux RND transporter permease subunit [Starkeya sp.]